MKLIHLSDLHLGKRVNEFNMLEDQEYILTKILNVIDEEKPDAVLIAGDIYDKAVPSAEAVQLFDDFLCRLQAKCPQIFVISGNHASPERIAFASRLIEASGVHLSPVYNGHIEPHVLHDEYGEVLIYMLPFVRPSHVRRAFVKDCQRMKQKTRLMRLPIRKKERTMNCRQALQSKLSHTQMPFVRRCDRQARIRKSAACSSRTSS